MYGFMILLDKNNSRMDLNIKQLFVHIKVIIFLFTTLTCVLGAQKNRLIETVLLSTQNSVKK